MADATFEELEIARRDLEESLQRSMTPTQRVSLEKIRSLEADRLQSQRATSDEALAQRVAEIMSSKTSGPRVYGTGLGQPARIVSHTHLQCKRCGHERPADHHADSKNPSAGGCQGDVSLTHDFVGAKTKISEVSKLEPHHAIYIEGTVHNPA